MNINELGWPTGLKNQKPVKNVSVAQVDLENVHYNGVSVCVKVLSLSILSVLYCAYDFIINK